MKNSKPRMSNTRFNSRVKTAEDPLSSNVATGDGFDWMIFVCPPPPHAPSPPPPLLSAFPTAPPPALSTALPLLCGQRFPRPNMVLTRRRRHYLGRNLVIDLAALLTRVLNISPSLVLSSSLASLFFSAFLWSPHPAAYSLLATTGEFSIGWVLLLFKENLLNSFSKKKKK